MILENTNNNLFDEWAAKYEADIIESKDEYPFSGYFDIVHFLKDIVNNKAKVQNVLDLGVGSGFMLDKILTGLNVDFFGVDFSLPMLALAKSKLNPERLIHWDISKGEFPLELQNKKFDYIISAYTFHHFNLETKVKILLNYQKLLVPSGAIIIADISFDSIQELKKVKTIAGKRWDSLEEKGYFIVSDFLKKAQLAHFEIKYIKISFCSGVFVVTPIHRRVAL